MTCEVFLSEMRKKGILFKLKDGKLVCDAPKGVLQGELLEEIKRRKEEIIDFLAGRTEKPLARAAATRLPDNGLSPSQERYWMIQQLDPDSPALNIPVVIDVRGDVRRDVLEKAFNDLISMHAVLRTVCHEEDGVPRRVTLPPYTESISYKNISHLPSSEKETELRRLIQAEVEKPFRLHERPLIRASLIQTEDRHYVLVVVTHHFVADGWSMSLLFQNLSDLYDRYCLDEAGTAEFLPKHQYEDYMHWYFEQERQRYFQKQVDYWLDRLKNPVPLKLPIFETPVADKTVGDSYYVSLSPAMTNRLREMSRQRNVTLFMSLLAAFKVMLYGFTNQTDITVGTTITNRNRKSWENIIGPFGNTLLLRTEISGNMSFGEVLHQVRERVWEAFANQDVAFEKIVRSFSPHEQEILVSQSKVLLIMHNEPVRYTSRSGLSFEPVDWRKSHAQADLLVDVWETSEGLKFHIEYKRSLFSPETVERMGRCYVHILDQLAKSPELPLSEISFVSAEDAALLAKWNDTYADYGADRCIHELFQERARLMPDAVAIYDGQGSVLYGELDLLSSKLSNYLLSIGAKTGDRIGIMLERSRYSMIAALAVLKSGCVYVPLDPKFSQERLRYMIEDAQIRIVVTRFALSENALSEEVRLVDLERRSEWMTCDATPPCVPVFPENPAYILYTSGSTGAPKGVIGNHAGILNRMRWMWETYPFTEGEVSLHMASLNFVDSLWEMFGPLLQGIPTVVIDDFIAKNVHKLISVLEEHSVSRIVLLPSLLKMLLEECGDELKRLTNLKMCITSGEALSADIVRLFKQTMGNCSLINLYGSTEVAADATYYDTSQWEMDNGFVPIGRPIGNMRVYILTSDLKLAPIGGIGEICVGGKGLAVGYLNMPELTNEKFIPDVFDLSGNAEKSRLYRTGDLGRFTADGNVQFLGRMDFQINFRGYRIEPGEIEFALNRHPDVEDCLVTSVLLENNQPVLKAYLVLKNPDIPLRIEQLKMHLNKYLPQYMIPTVYETIDSIPLLPNGKKDRKWMESKRESRLMSSAEKSGEEMTDTENEVVKILQEVLPVKGPYDKWKSIFELGGDSLAIMQISSRIAKVFGVELLFHDILDNPNIETIAKMIEQRLPSLADAK